MRKISVFVIFMTILTVAKAQYLSDQAKISVLTCSPGDELYQAFGHSAFRVNDPENKIDFVFNYGTFKFSDPNFYLKFILGRLNYMLSTERYISFINQYSSELNRDVYEQELDMTSQQKDGLYKFLLWNAQPENKYYLYDFFWDNCATRVRDAVNDSYGENISYPDSLYNLTFREMIDPYLRYMPWIHLGINTLLGLPADAKADVQLAMFLPEYMDTVFSKTIFYTDSSSFNLVKDRKQVVTAGEKLELTFSDRFLSPFVIFFVLLVILLVISALEFIKKKRYYFIDFIIALITGIAGLLVSFMWFGTEHKAVVNNLNIFWAVPFHAVFAFFLLRSKKPAFIKYYFLISGIIGFLILPLWNILPQGFDRAMIPFLLILSLRFFGIFWHEKFLKTTN